MADFRDNDDDDDDVGDALGEGDDATRVCRSGDFLLMLLLLVLVLVLLVLVLR